jgi:hypothetical protein
MTRSRTNRKTNAPAPASEVRRPAVLLPLHPVRASRVATAQARIAADYYDRGDVRDRLVRTLLSELKER